ncbi:hypothetical protein VTK73DRAFT_5819 [Phialemonium thermophilum]|uniref:D-xylose 1-dehydrogenase (NADP(+), D-xylono-1,5-lactone-forming) n=1 Tax=Phialemonium thermophilum TaxID=223376 RepID=A0ABR3WLJ6_9PEZI
MASVFGFLRRNWQILSSWRAAVPKDEDALKFGILGAANIAPIALIVPAKSHPGVIIQAVAARDKARATAYAKKHGIPQVFDSYQALLDDPSIDAVYIPLPNGLHYEWAVKALAKGKHVLLEKPPTANATEAELLFHSPLLAKPGAPVLLEASHYRFQPSWARFLALVDGPNVESASVRMAAPAMSMPLDDIRFRYELGGGAILDLGAYNMSALQAIFGTAPAECVSCDVETPGPLPRKAAAGAGDQGDGQQLCDSKFHIVYRFPNGGTGEAHGNLRAGLLEALPTLSVTHREVVVPAEEGGGSDSLPAEQEKVRVRRIKFDNFVIGAFWHRIIVEDEYIIRAPMGDGSGAPRIIKTWKTRRVEKVYTFKEAGLEGPGEPHWLSYRYQLEEFVNRIRGRQGSGMWVDAENSILVMRMLDMAYEKSTLPLRKTSEYRLEMVGES